MFVQISVVIFAILIMILIIASVHDVKTREINDNLWWFLGGLSVISFAILSYNSGFSWIHILIILGVTLVFYDILHISERSNLRSILFYTALILLFLIPATIGWNDVVVSAGLTFFLSSIFFIGLYFMGAIAGGADVKCLIGLSGVLPLYPVFLGFPIIPVSESIMSVIMPFSVAVLFFASAFVMIYSVRYLIQNIRDKVPFSKYIFFGRQMDLNMAKVSKVWPVQDVEDGELIFCRPSDENTSEIYERLEKSGMDRIWVTPIIPFIVPITVATIFVALIGNLLFLITG